MFARIGVTQALNRGHVREFNPKVKERHGAGASEGSMKDAFDLWWEWAQKPHESMLSIDGEAMGFPTDWMNRPIWN